MDACDIMFGITETEKGEYILRVTSKDFTSKKTCPVFADLEVQVLTNMVTILNPPKQLV